MNFWWLELKVRIGLFIRKLLYKIVIPIKFAKIDKNAQWLVTMGNEEVQPSYFDVDCAVRQLEKRGFKNVIVVNPLIKFYKESERPMSEDLKKLKKVKGRQIETCEYLLKNEDTGKLYCNKKDSYCRHFWSCQQAGYFKNIPRDEDGYPKKEEDLK